jgi:hypothetical protein
VHESLTVELKRELHRRDGKHPDPWMVGGDAFTDRARDHLFREIVAFANAQGGTLVLGIDQIAGNPPRAGAVTPLPRVHDLASRLQDAARACIEPPLGGLQIHGVVIDEGTGAGVVVFRTAASPRGPHRVASDGHAFIRRGASSVKMTMREIQDLTLDLARGADRLDALFEQRTAEFADWFRHGTHRSATGMRVTAAPVGTLPTAIRVARQPNGVPLLDRFQIQLEGSAQPLEAVVPLRYPTSRTILRGCRAFAGDDERAIQVDVLDRGVVDLWFWRVSDQDARGLYLGWLLATVILVLKLTHWIRGLAEAPEWEYAIELQIHGLSAAAGPTQAREPLAQIPLQLLGNFADTINVAPTCFPRLSWQSSAEEQDMLNLILRDVLDAGGARQEWPRIAILGAA